MSRFNVISYHELAFDLPSIAATTRGVATATLTGAETNDVAVFAEIPNALNDDLIPIKARVSAADTIEIAVYNPTAGAIDDASRTYGILLIKNAKANLASAVGSSGPGWAR